MRAPLLLLAATVVHAAPGRTPLVIPQVTERMHMDGELDEMAWRTPARAGSFAGDDGSIASPYSDARFLRDDHQLYVALYAADENIQSSDHFTVTFGSGAKRVTLQFAPNGSVQPVLAGVYAAADLDGSLDDPSNDDEEWVIEATIPLRVLPFRSDGTLPFEISRCDRTKDGSTHCGSTRGALLRR